MKTWLRCLPAASKAAFIVLGIAFLSASVLAQTYPAKPIKLVVPFPAGGGTDIFARTVGQKLSDSLKWVVIIDNKPGAGGNLGVETVAKSAPDGYTLVLGQTSNLAINPSLYSKLPYDPLKDLTPVVLVASAPMALVVPANSPFKTFGDVVAAAKAKPEQITFGTPGNGTVAHLVAELMQKTAGIKLQHVPYKGSAQGLTDLMGGQIQLYIASVPTALSQIKGGRLRAIAVSSDKRSPELPGVPTVSESGFKGFEASSWFGFVAPKGTPDAIVMQLNSEINKALKAPDVRAKLMGEGGEVLGGTPEQFAALLKTDLVRWARIVRESGAKLD